MTLKTDEKFFNWLMINLQQLSDGIYKNNTDAKWASRIHISLQSRDRGSKPRNQPDQENLMLQQLVARQQPREIATKDSTKKDLEGF